MPALLAGQQWEALGKRLRGIEMGLQVPRSCLEAPIFMVGASRPDTGSPFVPCCLHQVCWLPFQDVLSASSGSSDAERETDGPEEALAAEVAALRSELAAALNTQLAPPTSGAPICS